MSKIFARLIALDRAAGLHEPAATRTARWWWLPLVPVLMGAVILLAWGAPWWYLALLVGGVPSGVVTGVYLGRRQATRSG